jgi:2-polyprenyl-6-methoxyphenol hydroxylase-like FAD-dependent oxidoreductase
MKARRHFDIVVIGGGPAALMASLMAAKRGRTALVLDRIPAADEPVRIDVIPSRTLALLAEFGVRPKTLGVHRLMTGRWSSWTTDVVQWQDNAQTAHIERPLLELELFKLVLESGVAVIPQHARPVLADGFIGNGWFAKQLIDASGRAAITARERIQPSKPWGSRFFWLPRGASRATADFRIAPLREGYAYRLGSAERIGLGIVGRGELLKTRQASLESILTRSDAGWLLEDLPAVASMKRGASGAASVQWTLSGDAVLAGDAAIARDALSSQGLATSLSDALYAVAALGSTGPMARRHEAGLMSHLASLDNILALCRHGESPVFCSYRSFIGRHLRMGSPAGQPALRNGHLVSGDMNNLSL